MGIFSNIVNAIFGSKASPATSQASTAGSAPSTSDASVPPAISTASAQATSPSGSAPQPISREQVEQMIAGIAAKRGGKSNWKESIVDLMKLLDLDSGLGARKELAQELGYKGAIDGSAEMNLWLHKQVMTKLAEGGGTVPADLKS